ncbi:MAG: prepilin peptidase [Clostridia bacterium]|nr:prepilin peptidase [Clostridia bacterium]
METAFIVLLGVYAAVFGLVIGSFLNVCIYRIPRGESLSKQPSHCPACGARIRPRDLVPVFSYLFLRGKCRSCGAPISARYPAVELLNCACYIAVYAVYGLQPITAAYMLMCSALIVAAFVDFDHRIILDRIVIFLLAEGILLAVFSRDTPWLERLVGLFAVSVPLLLICIFFGGFGEGDVKLMAACGLVLGWKLIVLSLVFGSIFGSVAGITLIVRKKATRRSEIAFGPWLGLGITLAMLFGNTLITSYLRMIGL